MMLDYPMRHILCRHEQTAVHAIEGYYKASGQTGTAIVTSGPGATNTITGLTDALMDSMGIVVFTGQVPTGVMGCDAFQEADVVGTTRTCTKHNFLATRTEDLPRIVKEAYYIERPARPGPGGPSQGRHYGPRRVQGLPSRGFDPRLQSINQRPSRPDTEGC
jgi:acetolactate synthase-1/2/3 large subunit